MTDDSLALVSAANCKLASFLEKAVVVANEGGASNLAETQIQVSSLLATIGDVGRSLGVPLSLDSLDAEALAEIKLYATHLERLRNFLRDLQNCAENRRDQLGAGARQVADALAWCKTLELTNPE